MHALLTALVTWLAINFNLPATYEHPDIAFVAPENMSTVRNQRAADRAGAPGHSASTTHQQQTGAEVEAFYDDRTQTIYLPAGWTGRNPAQLSLLVHEMVHHLQNVAGLRHECTEAREKTAYLAQDRWLKMFGENLEEAFALDPMTLLVRTRCMNG
jgi:hypothetical protein